MLSRAQATLLGLRPSVPSYCCAMGGVLILFLCNRANRRAHQLMGGGTLKTLNPPCSYHPQICLGLSGMLPNVWEGGSPNPCMLTIRYSTAMILSPIRASFFKGKSFLVISVSLAHTGSHWVFVQDAAGMLPPLISRFAYTSSSVAFRPLRAGMVSRTSHLPKADIVCTGYTLTDGIIK